MAIVWYYNVSTSMIQCVIRSDTEDILWLAQMYGGGGHPQAATFSFPAKHIYEWLNEHEKRVGFGKGNYRLGAVAAAAGGGKIRTTVGFECEGSA